MSGDCDSAKSNHFCASPAKIPAASYMHRSSPLHPNNSSPVILDVPVNSTLLSLQCHCSCEFVSCRGLLRSRARSPSRAGRGFSSNAIRVLPFSRLSGSSGSPCDRFPYRPNAGKSISELQSLTFFRLADSAALLCGRFHIVRKQGKVCRNCIR